MVFIKEKPIEVPERKLDYPFVRSSLGRLGVNVRHREMQSNNYVAGSAGWALKSEGEIEARSIKIIAAAGSEVDWSYIQNVAVENADIVNATIQAAKIASLNADVITTGTLTGRTVRTAASGARVQLDSTNYLQAYDANVLRTKLDTTYLRFYNSSGTERGRLTAIGTYFSLLGIGAGSSVKLGGNSVVCATFEEGGFSSESHLPYVNNSGNIGTASYKWANVYCTTLHQGDSVFTNDWRITERGKDLIFKSPDGKVISLNKIYKLLQSS